MPNSFQLLPSVLLSIVFAHVDNDNLSLAIDTVSTELRTIGHVVVKDVGHSNIGTCVVPGCTSAVVGKQRSHNLAGRRDGFDALFLRIDNNIAYATLLAGFTRSSHLGDAERQQVGLFCKRRQRTLIETYLYRIGCTVLTLLDG